MNKMPQMEINCIPSQLNTSTNQNGVASMLANVAADQPHYDGVTIGEMRGNPLYQRLDDIDKAGLAKEQLARTAKTVKSNMKKIRAVNELGMRAQKPNKPHN